MVTLRFYDSQTRQVRDFAPLREGEVGLYYCGATVQGEPHVGHMRSAIVFDQLTRWLQHKGYRVTVIRNVTDIDDKILAKSQASFDPDFDPGQSAGIRDEQWWALAYRFEKVFDEYYSLLGVQDPTYEPRATGHIPEMHRLIQDLIERGHAYPAEDGSGDVYFDVLSWGKYGSLTNQNVTEMQAATDADPRGKRDERDFALWKGHKSEDPQSAAWDSPWGRGRPGWHLECSAMAAKYLGTAFDIHGGGLDLRFPHHENEMAQSQAAGQDFANFWMHNGMVTYRGEKMSKSVGNVISPAEMLDQASPRVVRYYLGQAHYRSVLDYNPESLSEAKAAVDRIDGFLNRAFKAVSADDLAEHGMWGNPAAGRFALAPHSSTPEEFTVAMDDDLNIPKALAVLHDQVTRGNQALADGNLSQAAQSAAAVHAMTHILGLPPEHSGTSAVGNQSAAALDALVTAEIARREEARQAKDWATSDAIRESLSSLGIAIEDGKDGATWSFRAQQ